MECVLALPGQSMRRIAGFGVVSAALIESDQDRRGFPEFLVGSNLIDDPPAEGLKQIELR